MNRVFADTFYFLALGNPRDAAHSRAVAAAQAAAAKRKNPGVIAGPPPSATKSWTACWR